MALVEARIVEADPASEAEQRKAYEQSRFVRSTRDLHGLSSLVARAATGDVVVLEAMVERIAEILGERGDADHVNLRRASSGRPCGCSCTSTRTP